VRHGTRWAIAAFATAILTVLFSLYVGQFHSAGTTPIDPASDPALARFYHQHIGWHDHCQLGPNDDDGKELDAADVGAKCAEVTVPLDYDHPNGRTITVALSLLGATDTAHRIGIMILNKGGAALAGRATVLARPQMGDAGTRFNLIGMDKRSPTAAPRWTAA
jgi:hypothetical protein